MISVFSLSFSKMKTTEESHVDLEDGGARRHSTAVSDGVNDTSSSSNTDHRSRHSPFDSGGGGSSHEDQNSSSVSGTEIVGVSDNRTKCSVSECSVEADLESGLSEVKVHLAKSERDCRICRLSFDASNEESGVPMELGCSCKNDLAVAHKQCAETWFRIKGNKACEICGSTARNVAFANETELMEQWNEANDAAAAEAAAAQVPPAEARNFWQSHRFLNFLLACMVFAFVISWLFHFNVPS